MNVRLEACCSCAKARHGRKSFWYSIHQVSLSTSSQFTLCEEAISKKLLRFQLIPLNMNIPNIIVDLNNRAVGCLLQDNGNGSVAALQMAISTLQSHRDMEKAARTNFEIHATLTKEQSLLERPWDTTAMHSGHCHLASIPLPLLGRDSECCGTFSIFNHAFTLSKSAELVASVSNNYDRFLAMLLYNMGLSLHIQALRSGKSEELRGALDLYEMSFGVVEANWQLFHIDDLMLILMALFNNLGHINSFFYNVDQIQICIDWLRVLAGHPAFLKLLQRDQYAPFSLNILVVMKQTQRCSPAA
jgi:hypothetical protein